MIPYIRASVTRFTGGMPTGLNLLQRHLLRDTENGAHKLHRAYAPQSGCRGAWCWIRVQALREESRARRSSARYSRIFFKHGILGRNFFQRLY